MSEQEHMFGEYRVVALTDPQIGEVIGECIHTGFLWVKAAPSPNAIYAGEALGPPTHLVFSNRLISVSEADALLTQWQASRKVPDGKT